MTTHIAFLRAINVAGHASVKMDDLKEAFVAAGCNNVRTVIQSGNVLFEAGDGDASAVIQKIQVSLDRLLGTKATVLFRTFRDVENIVKADPFKDAAADAEVKRYVAFLSQTPAIKPALSPTDPKEALEAIAVKNLEVFIVSRKKKNGMYGFPNNFIEKEFGVAATTRNWTTVTRIVNLLA